MKKKKIKRMLRRHYEELEIPSLKVGANADGHIGGISWLDSETIADIESGRVKADNDRSATYTGRQRQRFGALAAVAPCLVAVILVLAFVLPTVLGGHSDIDPTEPPYQPPAQQSSADPAPPSTPDELMLFYYAPADYGAYKRVWFTPDADQSSGIVDPLLLANEFFANCYNALEAIAYDVETNGGYYESGDDWEMIMPAQNTLSVYLTGEFPPEDAIVGETPGGIIIRCLVNTLIDNTGICENVRLYVNGETKDYLLFQRFDMELDEDRGDGADETEPSETEPTPMFTPITSGNGWQAIRTDGAYSDEPVVAIISSVDELMQYYNSSKESYDLESRDVVYSDSTIGFMDAIVPYGEEFFGEKELIFVILTAPSGSMRYIPYSVNFDADGALTRATVAVDTYMPHIGDDSVATWHLILEIPRSKGIDSIGQIEVVFLK